MKKVFIYGDSNVWGDNFFEGIRIPDSRQWPNILQDKLGSDFKIFQEGLPGRLAGSDETFKKYKNGKDSFLAIFRTKAPVDFIFIMLGTNDLQVKYNKSSDMIIADLLWYEDCIKRQFEDADDRKKYFVDEHMPHIVYILPCNFSDTLVFNDKSHIERKKIIDFFKKSDKNYIELNNMPLFKDGIHLNFDGHEEVASRVLEVLKSYE